MHIAIAYLRCANKLKINYMTVERIKEIQMKTAFPDSLSVYQALLQVWNECEQEHSANTLVSGSLPPDEYISKDDYDKAISEIGRLQDELSKAEDYIEDLSRGYDH